MLLALTTSPNFSSLNSGSSRMSEKFGLPSFHLYFVEVPLNLYAALV